MAALHELVRNQEQIDFEFKCTASCLGREAAASTSLMWRGITLSVAVMHPYVNTSGNALASLSRPLGVWQVTAIEMAPADLGVIKNCASQTAAGGGLCTSAGSSESEPT